MAEFPQVMARTFRTIRLAGRACKAAMRAFLCKRACLPDPMRKRTRASAVLWGASLRLCCSRALRFGRDGRRWLYLPSWQRLRAPRSHASRAHVTAAVPVDGRLCPVSAKTAQPIAKNRMLAALKEIRALRVQPPVREGDTLLENVAGTGVALVATKTVQ